jgi:hypothetical protein
MRPFTLAIVLGLAAGPAFADEPVRLDADQMDRVTAGELTAIVVFTATGFPNALDGPLGPGEPGLNLFEVHPGQSTETFVLPGAGAATTTPSGSHGSLPPPD